MSRLIELIKALAPRFKSQEELNDTYLADAIDIINLERRMREIDIRARNSYYEPAFGLRVRG